MAALQCKSRCKTLSGVIVAALSMVGGPAMAQGATCKAPDYSAVHVDGAGRTDATRNRPRVRIATAARNGTYHTIALQARDRIIDRFPLDVITTTGSIDNVEQLVATCHVKFAIVQSDVLEYIGRLRSPRFVKAKTELRYMFPMYLEEVHLIVRRDDDGIRSIADLGGKRVTVGEQDSGTAITALKLMDVFGVEPAGQPMFRPLGPALKDLFLGEVDAVFFVGGFPASGIEAASRPMRYRLVPIEGELPPEYDGIYVETALPAEAYGWAPAPTATLGVRAVLMTWDFKVVFDSYLPRMACAIARSLPDLKRTGHAKWQEVEITRPGPAGWTIYEPWAAMLGRGECPGIANGVAQLPRVAPAQSSALAVQDCARLCADPDADMSAQILCSETCN